MAEYINKEEVIEFLRQTRKQLDINNCTDFHTRDNMLLNFEQYINLQPVVKVKEIVQGKWIGSRDENTLYDDFKCSICGCYTDTRNRSRLDNYCGNCGAKMDLMNGILKSTSTLHEQSSATVSEIRRSEWELTVENPSDLEYHVTAHCGNCGWEWVGKNSECVGSNRYVFSAFISGDKELAEQFVINNAKQRCLYNYCPNCGSCMNSGEGD